MHYHDDECLGGECLRCNRCGEYFFGAAAFELHLAGVYSLDAVSRCLSGEEMIGRGLVLASRGYWVPAKPAGEGVKPKTAKTAKAIKPHKMA